MRQVTSSGAVGVIGEEFHPREKVLQQIEQTHVSMELVLFRLGARPKARHEGCNDKDVKQRQTKKANDSSRCVFLPVSIVAVDGRLGEITCVTHPLIKGRSGGRHGGIPAFGGIDRPHSAKILKSNDGAIDNVHAVGDFRSIFH